jgi:hypothetical protein
MEICMKNIVLAGVVGILLASGAADAQTYYIIGGSNSAPESANSAPPGFFSGDQVEQPAPAIIANERSQPGLASAKASSRIESPVRYQSHNG